MIEKYRLVHSNKEVKKGIRRLASEITADYNGDNSDYANDPLFVALLLGGAPFATDLMKEMTIQAPEFHPRLDYMMTSRVNEDPLKEEQTKIIKGLTPGTELKGNVIILDSVLDMGVTARAVRDYLLKMGAGYVRLAVLIEKETPRTVDIEADYAVFRNEPDSWLVGMGMADTAISSEAKRWDDSIWTTAQGDDRDQHARISV